MSLNLARNTNIKEINVCIGKIIRVFQTNPFNFLNEEDLRAHLFSALSAAIEESNFIILSQNRWTNQFHGKIFKINPWRAEYPEENQKGKNYSSVYGASKFDIALISKEDEPLQIPDENETNHYLLPISIALELKLRFNGFKVSNLQNDFNKLKKYKNVNNFLGIAFVFEQEPDYRYKKHIKYYSKHTVFQIMSFEDFHFEDNMIRSSYLS